MKSLKAGFFHLFVRCSYKPHCAYLIQYPWHKPTLAITYISQSGLILFYVLIGKASVGYVSEDKCLWHKFSHVVKINLLKITVIFWGIHTYAVL